MSEYEAVNKLYDDVLRHLSPKLHVDTVNTAIDAVNILVRLQMPPELRADNSPRAVLGMTADGERVVYGDNSSVSFYHAKPFDDVQGIISSMVDRAKVDYDRSAGSFLRQAGASKVEALEQMLQSLVDIKQE
jgi:hypothetical protein